MRETGQFGLLCPEHILELIDREIKNRQQRSAGTFKRCSTFASLPWEREEDAGEVEARWRTQGKNAQVAEYGANAFKSLARSHPAVMAGAPPPRLTRV